MAETKYKQTEVGLIPVEWEVVKIGEISSSRMYGVGASAIGYDGRTKYIRITDIDDNCGRFTPNPLTSPQYYLDRHIVREDDLLVARTGASVGKTYLYDKADGRLVFAGFLMKVHIDRGSSKYIFYQTKTNFYKLWVESESARTGQPGINIKQFENFSVPIPPLPEQHAIASALTSVDNLIASLDKQIAKTQSVKQGAMQQLLTGLNTEDVTWKPLYECLGYEQPARYIVKSSDYYDAGVPVLTAGQSFILGYTKETDGVFEASRECPVIIFDDFTTSFHWVEFKFKVKSSAMKMLRPISKDISFKYVHYAMNCINYEPVEHCRQWISMYSKFTIPIPSLETQHRIASTLTAIDDQISALEAKRRKYEMVKLGMMQQLLTGKIRLK